MADIGKFLDRAYAQQESSELAVAKNPPAKKQGGNERTERQRTP